MLPGYDQPIRTRRAVAALTDELLPLGWTAEEAQHAAAVFFAAYLPGAAEALTSKEGAASAETVAEAEDAADGGAASTILLFLTRSQYADLAALADEHKDLVLATKPEKKVKNEAKAFKQIRGEINEILRSPRGLITLFGRMIANLPEANVDAAAQVAHAFTVHTSAPE